MDESSWFLAVSALSSSLSHSYCCVEIEFMGSALSSLSIVRSVINIHPSPSSSSSLLSLAHLIPSTFPPSPGCQDTFGAAI
jgi:hypothetical protein